MQEKIWEHKSDRFKREEIIAFAKELNLPPVIAVLLLNRGINSPGIAQAYLKKSLENVHNPFLLNDMDTAVDRIIQAIQQKAKITIYGDYDVDGITSTAMLFKFLRSLDAEADYFIPDRKDGYGLNVISVNRIARGGTKLMITVDCGITSVGEVEFAKTQKMDVIITDHHTCKEELPRALAVITPKRPDSTYPFDSLAGVGVAFKLVLALAMRMGMSTKEVFMQYVDLAALGTIADVVPLEDENRIIVDKGIKALAEAKNIGIRALIAAAGMEGKTPDSTSVAFFLAPRLNAAGRLAHAKIAVELLIEEDYQKALETAGMLNETNTKRQAIERAIYEEALEQALSFEEEQMVYVLHHQGWHCGVIGIAASKICERFYRPCILIACEDGKGKGSGRSIEELNLFDALSDSEELLALFGGHAQAAGLSITEDNIEAFRIKINEYAKKLLSGKQLSPKLQIDCRISPENITMGSAKMLARLEPFGQCNENPVFSASGMTVLSATRMGADGKHLRLWLKSGSMNFNAVGFNMGDFPVREGEVIDIAFNLNINVYQGNENLQLLLKDIKKTGTR